MKIASFMLTSKGKGKASGGAKPGRAAAINARVRKVCRPGIGDPRTHISETCQPAMRRTAFHCSEHWRQRGGMAPARRHQPDSFRPSAVIIGCYLKEKGFASVITKLDNRFSWSQACTPNPSHVSVSQPDERPRRPFCLLPWYASRLVAQRRRAHLRRPSQSLRVPSKCAPVRLQPRLPAHFESSQGLELAGCLS
jgi:hypothetical protein